MAILEVEHVCKSFDQTEVLKDISFQLGKKARCFPSSVPPAAERQRCCAA